jgi:pyrimidine-nucleoside phosphorylase
VRIYEVITKKKHGEELSDEEIYELISEYTAGGVPDYQMSSLLMAICLKGMNDRETATLTDAIARSGDMLDLSEFGALAVDKHSTGGVGDKTTMVVAPIAAALGCKVAKMSGRGLGHTGGTIDKLESFPGYNTSLTPDEFFDQVRRTGIAVTGQSGNLAPADKKLYALRDVTATVDSIPLITSSVMGKKLASGAGTIVLDVKYGSGSFMKTAEDAERLASKMVEIGKLCGRRVAALITSMDTPLGHAIGNILEVKEAIATLKGNGPADFTEVCLALASNIVHLALGIDPEDAKVRARAAIDNGTAYNKFVEWIGAQGGDTSLALDPERFPKAKYVYEIKAPVDGFIVHTNAEKIGLASVALGAGRATKDSLIDYSAGIILEKKTGDQVKCGDVIARLYANDESFFAEAQTILCSGVEYGEERTEGARLIHGIIR